MNEPGWMDVMSVGMTSATRVSSGSFKRSILPLRSLMTRFGAAKLSTVPRSRTGGVSCAPAVLQAKASNSIRQGFIDRSGLHARGEMRLDGLQQLGKDFRARG